MKRILIAVLVGLAHLSQAQESENRSVSSFKGLKAAESIDVYLKKGDKESVRIEVSGIKTSDVLTEISGEYLKIHMREGRYRDGSVKVYVTYVNLEKLSVSSAANIFSESAIKAKQLSMSASSAGSIDVQVEAEGIELSVSSAGDVELSGKVGRLDIEVSSGGEIDAYDLTADAVDVEASSAGSAKVNAVKEITAHASSGGSIRFKGNPERSNTTSSSGGSVKKSS